MDCDTADRIESFRSSRTERSQDPLLKETEVKKSKGPLRRLLRICLDIFLVCGVIGNGRQNRLEVVGHLRWAVEL